MTHFTDLSATQLAEGYKAKEFTATEVTKAHLAEIEKQNSNLNVFLEVYDDALAQAESCRQGTGARKRSPTHRRTHSSER